MMFENNELSVKQLLPKAIEVLNENPERDYWGICWSQRMLKIGYNKASELANLLEDQTYIASPDELGKRKILKRD